MATLNKTGVWLVRKQESMILAWQLAVSATIDKEINYIIQSPEAEQASSQSNDIIK